MSKRKYNRPKSHGNHGNNHANAQTAAVAVKPNRPPQTTRLHPSITDGNPFFAADGFSNPLARLGRGSDNLMGFSQYSANRMSQDVGLLNALYRDNPTVKRLIDAVPEDMCKSWYKITGGLELDEIAKIARIERVFKVRQKLLDGLRWGRLYGGAIGLIIIDGEENSLDKPLRLDAVMPGSFKGLLILDRWSGVTAGVETVTDINSPDFGLPKYYSLYGGGLETDASSLRVHHSRVVRFTGRPLPYVEALGEQFWGASELEHVYDELVKYDNTSWNIAALTFHANLRVYRVEGMGTDMLMSMAARKQYYETMHAMNLMMNNNGMQIIGANDSLETHNYTFAGLAEVKESFMLDIAGAAEIPVTKLFGRAPAGMNATGESDMQNYYDSIEQKQEAYLRPVIETLLPVMCVSELGYVPEDLDFDFISPRRPTETERKTLAAQVETAVRDAYTAGIFGRKTALLELKASSDMTGMWTNITNDDIEEAEDEADDGDVEGVFDEGENVGENPFTSQNDGGIINGIGKDGGEGSGVKGDGAISKRGEIATRLVDLIHEPYESDGETDTDD